VKRSWALLALLGMLALMFLMVNCGGGSAQKSTITVPPPSNPFSPALGSVQLDNGGSPVTCESGLKFAPGVTCYHATVTCPSTVALGVTLGYQAPAAPAQGTIVLFSGGGGTEAGALSNDSQYTADYASNGYGVVETAWDSAWEDTTNGSTSNVPAHNLLAAGCRPASLLNYIFSQSTPFYTSGGRCAQGISGGSGAVAYTMSAYGGDGFLDNAELLSGPVFGDIEQGCEFPPAPEVTVCGDGNGGVAAWCHLGPGQSLWAGRPTYMGSALTAVQGFTGDSSCGTATPTSATSNQAWKNESIVNGAASTNFNYTNTKVTGWLCADSSNNSTEQGQFFYQQVGTTATPLNVYPVSNCQGAEGVDTGDVPALSGDPSGFTAVEFDMLNACHKTP